MKADQEIENGLVTDSFTGLSGLQGIRLLRFQGL